MPTVEDLIQLGFSLQKAGKYEDAEHAYQEALSQDKDNAEIYNLMGVLKLQQNDVISAVHMAELAVEKNPNAYFYETLFQTYIRAGIYKQIVAREHEVMEKFPDDFSLLFNLALAHKNLRHIPEAIKYYDRALRINPASYDAWFNLSHLYSIEGETKNAVSALKICKKIRPNNDTDYFLSLALMRVKDYKHGLKLFENRLCRETAFALLNKSYPNKARKDNLWDGKNIKNKTLLVYYEAGFGDVIMFSRYLPLVKQKCGKLIFYCQKPLAPLFEINKQLGIDEIVDKYIPEDRIDFDYHIPLLSLPYVLKLSGEKVFAHSEGYLHADKTMVEEYRKKYFENDKLKIGIKWQGNTYYDQDRVIPSTAFIPLMEVENTQFYSFQTFEGAEDIKDLNNIVDIGKDLLDFSQTAAALSNLDLVICNDTSLAHLAGAMGIPCWIVLPYEVNWRWHTDLSVCDWYDSVRLFRQHKLNDWNGVFEDVKAEMVNCVAKTHPDNIY